LQCYEPVVPDTTQVLLDRSWGKSVKAVEIHKLAEAQTHAFGEAPDKLSVKELEQLVGKRSSVALNVRP
jgi:hypothetical protein